MSRFLGRVIFAQLCSQAKAYPKCLGILIGSRKEKFATKSLKGHNSFTIIKYLIETSNFKIFLLQRGLQKLQALSLQFLWHKTNKYNKEIEQNNIWLLSNLQMMEGKQEEWTVGLQAWSYLKLSQERGLTNSGQVTPVQLNPKISLIKMIST